MSLDGYAANARAIAQEIDVLDDAQIDELRALLLRLGLRGWWRWQHTHAEQIAKFVAAAPSARQKLRLLPSDRLLLLLGAYQHCHGAADFLERAERLRSGVSYRKMTAEAGQLYRELQGIQNWPDWPWDAPDPFDDEEFRRR